MPSDDELVSVSSTLRFVDVADVRYFAATDVIEHVLAVAAAYRRHGLDIIAEALLELVPALDRGRGDQL